MSSCKSCRGTGGPVEIDCPNCNGSGYDPQEDKPFAQCHTCFGDGFIEADCEKCGGTGERQIYRKRVKNGLTNMMVKLFCILIKSAC